MVGVPCYINYSGMATENWKGDQREYLSLELEGVSRKARLLVMEGSNFAHCTCVQRTLWHTSEYQNVTCDYYCMLNCYYLNIRVNFAISRQLEIQSRLFVLLFVIIEKKY